MNLSWIYLLRLLAFVPIIAAIVGKNLRQRSRGAIAKRPFDGVSQQRRF